MLFLILKILLEHSITIEGKRLMLSQIFNNAFEIPYHCNCPVSPMSFRKSGFHSGVVMKFMKKQNSSKIFKDNELNMLRV